MFATSRGRDPLVAMCHVRNLTPDATGRCHERNLAPTRPAIVMSASLPAAIRRARPTDRIHEPRERNTYLVIWCGGRGDAIGVSVIRPPLAWPIASGVR
jgi:hypothetical protein